MMKSARFLRDWARSSIIDGTRTTVHHDLNYSEKVHHDRSEDRKSKLSNLEKRHEDFDKFFNDLGLHLPKTHPMVRSWDHHRNRLRAAAERRYRFKKTARRPSKDSAKDEHQQSP